MIDQPVADAFLRCPDCHNEKSLKCFTEAIICNNCGFEAKAVFGIPALIKKEETGIHSGRFLDLSLRKDTINKARRSKNLNLFLRVFSQEALHFLNIIFFSYKFGIKKILQKTYCAEVEKAIRYGWKNYFNLILKANEIFQFYKMKNYIIEPSLEIGCGDCRTTNMIFKDTGKKITFGCEYFMDNFLNLKGELSEEMYKVIKHYLGGSCKSLPFRTGILGSVVMVHIIDHVIHTSALLKEIHRVLKPGGCLIMSGYSKNTFEHLPGVKLRNMISKRWASRYKTARVTMKNPRGSQLKSDFEYDANGQNMFSLAEWRDICNDHGFRLADFAFFGRYFSYFTDMEYRGYYNSFLFNRCLYAVISAIVEREKINPLSEEDSTNVILVLQKNV